RAEPQALAVRALLRRPYAAPADARRDTEGDRAGPSRRARPLPGARADPTRAATRLDPRARLAREAGDLPAPVLDRLRIHGEGGLEPGSNCIPLLRPDRRQDAYEHSRPGQAPTGGLPASTLPRCALEPGETRESAQPLLLHSEDKDEGEGLVTASRAAAFRCSASYTTTTR